ncbi:hypothetical protein TraAM80_01632 [Trypanosoma rangeli]|uniref:Uncharacterized protein n=1 Tax=Trypanosoma rangeli TaxID=5698 RepID=A0A3R7KMA6_TRYRA|nr:uncharacterized protein TraAM80_01632 [Trypanosoma rangeli]RNF10289.1 hypothetical protein TraAM80_01632 [Trypanosoma rangeli]|eukprot:RNF10289.1 hypothetical protein TraAM80_01632 [Trypanosoma rangeli]
MMVVAPLSLKALPEEAQWRAHQAMEGRRPADEGNEEKAMDVLPTDSRLYRSHGSGFDGGLTPSTAHSPTDCSDLGPPCRHGSVGGGDSIARSNGNRQHDPPKKGHKKHAFFWLPRRSPRRKVHAEVNKKPANGCSKIDAPLQVYDTPISERQQRSVDMMRATPVLSSPELYRLTGASRAVRRVQFEVCQDRSLLSSPQLSSSKLRYLTEWCIKLTLLYIMLLSFMLAFTH